MRYKGACSKFALLACIISFFILGFLGTVRVTPMSQYLARVCTVIYFAYFLLMPLYSRYEQHRLVPERIG